MNLKKYISSFVLLVSLVSFSQEKWTLDECVAYAIEHNLQVKNTAFNNDSSKESYRQSIKNGHADKVVVEKKIRALTP